MDKLCSNIWTRTTALMFSKKFYL
uniref:Uncharacterized protein n=1 Tax=Lepeophtheirus salmonis TaxID=72036 RepID=A0A0K2U922_LEPSM